MNWLSLLGLEAVVARWRATAIEGAIAAEDRLGLARMEWNDQKQRLLRMLILTVLAGGLTVVAFIMLSTAVLVHFWDSPDRTLVAWIVAGAWLLAWGIIVATLISLGRRATSGFALTRRELAQDWRDIKERL